MIQSIHHDPLDDCAFMAYVVWTRYNTNQMQQMRDIIKDSYQCIHVNHII